MSQIKKPQTEVKLIGNDEKRYLGSKNVVLELLSVQVDKFGASYYVCFDPEAPEASIRYYMPRFNLADPYKMGSEILCDIANVCYSETDKSTGKPTEHYKVIHSTVVEIDETMKGVKEEAHEYFLSHKGVKLPSKTWLESYGVCACCTGVVNPRFNFRFTTTGDPICHECVEDAEVSSLMSFAK